MARKSKAAAPRKPRRKTDNQIFIRTTTEIVAATQAYADQEDRSLSKAAERLLIEALQQRGLLERAPPVVPAEEERVRGGADAVV